MKDSRLAWAAASPLLRFWFIKPLKSVPEPCMNKSISTKIFYSGRTTERRVLTLLAALPATLLAGVLSVPIPPFTAVFLPDEAIVAF